MISPGNRSWRAVRRAPFEPAHYRALAGAFKAYRDPFAGLYRFLTARGSYPYDCELRTPTGLIRPRLYSSHDISTVNEIFCRRDYEAGPELGVAVDVGANIGIASLYFLTRNRTARVYAFEPAPHNVPRLRATLAGREDRYELREQAVGLEDGPVSFGIEPTGRYGGIGEQLAETITVQCREINSVLDDVLGREDRIDVLKIDVEGLESELVRRIRPETLDRIGTIYYETDEPDPQHLDRFDHAFEAQTNRLTRR